MKTLERQLGLLSVLGISMGAMLGSGLFVLPGLAVAQTGSSVWLAYLVAGICVLPAALSKAELATAMPVSGGTYVYIDRTLGPLASTISGIGLWLSLLLKSSFALVGFGAYLRVLTDAPVTAVGLGLLAVIIVLNIVGVRKVSKMQVWVVLLSVASLTALSTWGLDRFRIDQLQHSFAGGTLGFFGTVAFVYISFAGVTKIAAVAEEVKNPGRNLPLGILLSLGIVTLLYVAITFVLVGVVPASELAGDLRPIYTMALRIGGPIIGVGAAVLGVLTMTSMANAGLMAASRFPFAMSREHLLPTSLGFVSRRFMTPVASIVLTGAVMAAAIAFLDVAGIAKIASSLMIVGFMLVNLAVIVLRESGAQWYKPTFHSPMYPLVQIVGLLVGLVLLFMLGLTGLVAVVSMIIPGFAVFVLFGRHRTDRRGVLGRLGPRRELIADPPLDLDAILPKSAAVVVPLVASEGSTEALVEIAGALADGDKVEVVHLTEVPEQLMLDATLEEDPHVDSLRRRTEHLAEERSLDVEFDALVTRDMVRTVHEISRRVHCNWVVMPWRASIKRGVLHFNPLGWLVDHLSCNLAILKDSGLRQVREILVLTKPGPHDALVTITADRIAQANSARLTFARFVESDASAMSKQVEMDYIEQLSKLCSSEPGCRIVQGKNKLSTLAAISPEYDLLIMGAPDARLRDYLRGSFPERLTRAAACSVLRLKTPRELTHDSIARNGSSSDSGELNIANFLTRGCQIARLEQKNKEALFSFFAGTLAKVSDLPKRRIEDALWKRERAQNTAVDDGLALPHATLVDAKKAYLGVFTTARPIDYKAPDGKLVDVFFVTLGPPSARNTHLRVLAGIANLVIDPRVLKRLRAAKNLQDLRAVLEGAGTSQNHGQTESRPRDGH